MRGTTPAMPPTALALKVEFLLIAMLTIERSALAMKPKPTMIALSTAKQDKIRKRLNFYKRSF